MVRTIICAPRRSFIGVAWYTRAFRHVNGSAFSFCLIVCAPRRPFIGVAWCARLFVHRDERLSASHGAQEPSAPWSVQHFCFPKCVCTATIVYRRRMVHVAFHHLGRFCFLGYVYRSVLLCHCYRIPHCSRFYDVCAFRLRSVLRLRYSAFWSVLPCL